MGTIVYDGDVLEFKVDDRLLAHLQIVIINKFRKGESFLFSWKESLETGDGRATVWLNPNIGLRFTFSGSRAPTINPSWLKLLYEAADSGRGLYALAEPDDDSRTHIGDSRADAVDWSHENLARGAQRRPRPPAA